MQMLFSNVFSAYFLLYFTTVFSSRQTHSDKRVSIPLSNSLGGIYTTLPAEKLPGHYLSMFAQGIMWDPKQQILFTLA